MAVEGMALRRGENQGNTEGADDVQRSIELLDRVLSEFDDVENANQIQNVHQQVRHCASTPSLRQQRTNSSSTPDDESPSIDHQSEDDGYMSMNGKKQAKFNLAFRPVAEAPVNEHNSAEMHPGHPDDFPPPPEEAQRLIATLLPIVSPTHRQKPPSSTKNNIKSPKSRLPITKIPLRIDTIPPPQRFQNHPLINGLPEPMPNNVTATQATLPKTRHQRPYGWENNDFTLNPPPPPPGYRFGSLPYQHGMYPLTSPTRVPPRTIPTTALERHREVRRHGSEDNLSSDLEEPNNLRPLSELADDEHFSDDSLEDHLPPPPPSCFSNTNKRSSIAWEVPFDDEALLTPGKGSTKVIGRRRRKSGCSHSSTSSIPNRLKDLEDWPDPPPACTTEDELMSPYSDCDDQLLLPSELNSSCMSGTSTYIVRRGKKDRKSLMASSITSNSSLNSRLSSEFSIVASRFSIDEPCTSPNTRDDFTSRISRELNTPNSRYSIDLSTPHSRLSQELNSPKSRFSLDLNNSRGFSQELSSSPSRLSADLSVSSRSSTPSKHQSMDVKRHSTTFDNIRSLTKEGMIEDIVMPLEEEPARLEIEDPSIVRVISLPSLSAEELGHSRRELGTTVEEEEDGSSSHHSSEISPLRKIEKNISELLERFVPRRDIEVTQDGKFLVNGLDSIAQAKKRAAKHQGSHDLQKSSSHSEVQRSEDYYRQLLIEAGNPFPKRNGIQKSESAKEMKIMHREREIGRLPTSTSADFPVHVEVLQHDFPPLPPSPVEEADDEYSEILNPGQKRGGDTLSSNSEIPPTVPPHTQHMGSLKTRSMESSGSSSYSRGRRNNFYLSNRANIPPERRTLPTELQDSKRRQYQKRSSHSPQEERHLQTSCSLPETPIFARGCDIPRTPHRRAAELPGNHSAPRQSNTMGSLNTLGNVSISSGGYRRQMSHSGLEQAIVGADLLRLAGGPNRGWYPRQKGSSSRRPVSIEHLDRMSSAHSPWEQAAARKPLTLPPNLTPKFFQRSPRDALRRVTSLLIRKGNNGKESKKEKDLVSPTIPENVVPSSVPGEDCPKKKGFFKNFWKRSKHYSLEQQ